MNVKRIVILAVAAVAAGIAVLLVRNLIGGGTPPATASLPNVQTSDVLVAAGDINPGQPLDSGKVRWQAWPKDGLSSSYLTKDVHPDAASAIAGTVVRTPILSGEPITENKIVRTNQTGYMAAMIQPGKRAVAIPITAELGAGGFILPNDHVDVMATRRLVGARKEYQTETILHDVRVLAIDQTVKGDKDTQTALGKIATLELTPEEAELVALSQASGTLSLELRGLNESADSKHYDQDTLDRARGGTVTVIRYGLAHSATPEGRPQ